MTDRIVLTLRHELGESLEVDGLTPDRCAVLAQSEIAALPLWIGSRRAQLGDLFSIDGERSDRVHIEGDLSHIHGIAMHMQGGTLTIDGNVGDRFAAGMLGGVATVGGNAGDDAGVRMHGGVLRIRGNAGDRLAAALPGASKGMVGGEIVVDGSAGAYVAARARRGVVAVGGDVGAYAGHRMIAGTLVVFGRVGPNAGHGNKRGSIIALGHIDVPVTYTYASSFEPPHVRLLLQHLRRRHDLRVNDALLSSAYQRYCGDVGTPEKGEILVAREGVAAEPVIA